MIEASGDRHDHEEAGDLGLHDLASVLHKFLHLVDHPSITVQLTVLLQCLILLGLSQRPYVVAQPGHAFLELDLRLLIAPEVGKLEIELVVRLDEVLNEHGEACILPREVDVNEGGLHLREPVEHERALSADRAEGRQAAAVVRRLEGEEERLLQVVRQSQQLGTLQRVQRLAAMHRETTRA